MLEDRFSLPRTVDRIRALWLGTAIERYVDWLADRRHAPSTIRLHVQVLVHFDAFAAESGATSWNELPTNKEETTDLAVATASGVHFLR